MKPRKRPISLETDVYRKLWELEHKAYLRAHAWKKSYRYTLIDEYRQHITFAKNAYITGFEMLVRYKEEKVQCYKASIGELSIVPKHSTDAYYRQQYHQLKIQLP